MGISIEDTEESEIYETPQDVMRDSLGWIDIRKNPTGDRFYKLKGIPLKVFDRKVLSYMDESNAKEVIDNIIRKHVRGVQLEKLLFPERKWLVFWLRYTSFHDSAYTLDWICDECGAQCSKKAELNDFKVWMPREDLKLEGNALSLKSGNTAAFRMETVELHNEIQEFIKLQKDRGRITNTAEEASLLEMATVAALLEEYNGNKRNGLDGGTGIEFLETLGDDYDEMQLYVDDIVTGWGISSRVKDNCSNPNCGGESVLNVTFRRDFFIAKN